MLLSDDIQSLRDRVLAELNDAHDYFAHSKLAWRVLRQAIAPRSSFAVHSKITGTVSSQSALLQKVDDYIARQLTETTFQQFISIFEAFFFDFLRLWLLAYPRSLMGRKVDFKTVLDAPDKEAIALSVVNRELNEILYERPAEWFAYLEDKVKLGCPTVDEVDRIAEAKATRDVLIHNRGVATKAYESKAGRLARFHDGELLDIPQPYHRQIWELLRKVAADVCDAALAKC